MMGGVSEIAADSLPFLVITIGLVLVAWSQFRSWFSSALLAASAVVLVSWLTLAELGALFIFVTPSYLICAWRWGRLDAGHTRLVEVVLVWQIAFFIVLRKYAFLDDIPWLDHPLAIIGLSYILFRVIHLMVEAPYLGHLPFGPARYLTYTFAYWTLLSGPIQRYEDFCAGLATIARPPLDDVMAGGHRAVNGLIKAFLIAPLLQPTSHIGILGASHTTWLDAVIVFYSFPIYLYLNFAGYTDLVIGVTRLCGMQTMPENFNRPYLARNIQDFWARWHISFSDWIRYYVFTPLSKRLLIAVGPRSQSATLAIAVIATFLVVGAWHGTTVNLLLFGLAHGLALIVGNIWGGFLKRTLGNSRKRVFERHPLVRAAATLTCLHYVCFTMLLFNNSLEDTVVGLHRLWS